MAHFAKLNSDNEVIDVIVVHNNELLDENGDEQESLGIAFCQSIFGEDTNWVQTSYNNNMRGYFAAVGYTYEADADKFKEPQPYPSCGWNETKYNDDGQGWEELYHYPTWVQNKIWVWNIDLQVYEAVQPYPSWTQNENGLWQAPVAYPDTGDWEWSEQNQNWVEYTP